jgi:alpha,alpha-trehalase
LSEDIEIYMSLNEYGHKSRKSEIFSTTFEDVSKQLYLNDKYLQMIHLAYEKRDSKSFVDRPTKKSLESVLLALDELNANNTDMIKDFVNEYLHEPGFEIVRAELTDWQASPKYIDNFQDQNLKKFSLAINEIWKDLYKRLDLSKLVEGAVSSHLPIKNAFMVPGGRFLEMYYWDNYWILEGLLISGMFETSKSILDNHIFLIEKYGFVPNGSRVYYLTRSQPPYFALMLMSFYKFVLQSKELSEERKMEYKRC